MSSAFRKIVSKNPFTNQVIKEFPFIPNSELTQKIERANEGYQINKKIPLKLRAEKLEKLASLIETNAQKYAKLVTTEMGKPISASLAEVKKCALGCRYYAEHGANLAKASRVKTDAKKSLVEFQPLGALYHLAPFNFPFWLGFKATLPAVLIGNTILHRNSDSTPLCGLAIEELFQQAGFDEYEFQNVFTSPEQTEYILSHSYVRGVSFTGSNPGGSAIGALAGKYIKKAALELGGSDPFIVLRDADINFAVNLAMNSRLQNSGQVCFAGKRFIVDDHVYDQFKEKLLEKIATMKIGDPSKPETQMGPLARSDLVDNIHRQVQQSVDEGANLLYGGKRLEGEGYGSGNFYMPTVCEMPHGLDTKNVLLKEETFGPVFALIKAKNEEEAVAIANNTEFGLGCVIVSKNTDKAEEIGKKIESGSVFINELVRSDVRLPSGGTKNSGFGRELGEYGVHEFANIKTIWVN